MNPVPSTAYSQDQIKVDHALPQGVVGHEPINVITVTLRYGQLVPAKVLRWQGTSPCHICLRWGGIFQKGGQGYYEPIADDLTDLTVQDRMEAQYLIHQPWVFPPKPVRPIPAPNLSNRVETLDDALACYRNK